MTIYTPYTYIIGWSQIKKFYYGVRYAKKTNCLYSSGCHPDDFWNTYFTSCSIIKEYRKIYGEPDVIEIRKTFNDAESARKWEIKVLRRMKVTRDDKWLNSAIPGCSKYYTACKKGSFTQSEDWKKMISLVNSKPKSEKTKDKMRKPKTREHAENISKGRKGISFSETHKENIRKATTGVKQSEATKQKRSASISNLKWYNNGIVNCRKAVHPGNEWLEGRISL